MSSIVTGKSLCEGDPEELISCPFDEVHMLRRKRMPYHIIKCGKNFNKKDFRVCPFNYRHVLKKNEFEAHLAVCQDRGIVEREMLHNKHVHEGIVPIQKGYTDIPVSTFTPPEPEESWDDSNVVVDIKPQGELFGKAQDYGPIVAERPSPSEVSQVRPPPQPRMPAATGAVGSEVFKHATQSGPPREPIPAPSRGRGVGRGRGRGLTANHVGHGLTANHVGRGIAAPPVGMPLLTNGHTLVATPYGQGGVSPSGVGLSGPIQNTTQAQGVGRGGYVGREERQDVMDTAQEERQDVMSTVQETMDSAGGDVKKESQLDADKKRERKLKKMLRQIVELEEKHLKGFVLDQDALAKISRKEDVISMLKQIHQ